MGASTIGDVVTHPVIAVRKLSWNEELEVCRILDHTARVAWGEADIDDAGIERVRRIDFARHRAIDHLVFAGAEALTAKSRRCTGCTIDLNLRDPRIGGGSKA